MKRRAEITPERVKCRRRAPQHHPDMYDTRAADGAGGGGSDAALRAVAMSSQVPRPPEPYIPRMRLDRQLGDAVRRPVTLVSAGAGTGKTTLLAAWCRTQPDRSVAW